MNKRGKSNLVFGKTGQVWIETVIYTLIAFVMIGLVLSFAKPKIEEMQDKALIQQSIEMLKNIDSTILTMGAAGNQRILELTIKKGILKIDGEKNKISFELETKAVYSELDKEINDGSIVILTQKKNGANLVTLTRNYNQDYDIKFQGEDIIKELAKASTAYNLKILNEGEDGKILLNLSVN